MKKFITTLVLFLIPFAFFVSILFYIDPYNIIREEDDLILSKLKAEISYKKNYPLYMLQEYSNNPTDIIVLGDSRSHSLKSEYFEMTLDKEITNFGYGGGTIPEIIETFWAVNEIHKFKEVYIGIDFMMYNALHSRNTVPEAISLRKSVTSYLVSKYSIKSTVLILRSIFTEEEIEIEKPPYTRKEFWKRQLDVAGPNFFENYIYPNEYFIDLIKVSKYCSKNNIRLTFFIAPTYIGIQDKLKEYNREKEYEKFVSDLTFLNQKVYNFDFPNELTANMDNFSDPFHFKRPIGIGMVKIMSGDTIYAKTHNSIFKILN